nr:GntR family transcriptional regulator [Defluviimonas sediminis]
MAEEIRQAILSGEMEPGSRVNLDRLRERFGVSLSPVREAVARLVHAGLVEFEDQRGYRVAQVSADNLAEVTRLRAELESLAAGLAAERAGLDWEGEVMAALHRLNRVDPADAFGWDAAHATFHHTLVGGAGMPILSDFCAILLGLHERYRRIGGNTPPPTGAAGHDAIVEAAALRRDAQAARQLVRAQIEDWGERLARRFEDHTSHASRPTTRNSLQG